jgi:hypothetical protein
MTVYYRFHDLVAKGYVSNRMTLKRWRDAGRFPPPVVLGPNTKAWTDEQLAEVDARAKAGITKPNPAWLTSAEVDKLTAT